jgi:hypothetical protein
MIQRLRLRRAARRYADHDWPVVPGARLSGDRFDCDQIGCPTVTCHPAVLDWERQALLDPDRIAGWWQRSEYGVLLATGHTFDVLEVAGPVGRKLAREVHGPVAVAPNGKQAHRWMFVLRGGAGLLPALAGNSAVVLHRAGSWIPAPPTPLPTGAVRWVTRPGEYAWEPADPVWVQRAAARMMRISMHSPDHKSRQVWRVNAPRQASAE